MKLISFQNMFWWFLFSELEFPSSFTSLERAYIHTFARELGYKSQSRGFVVGFDWTTKSNVPIVFSGKAQPGSLLFTRLSRTLDQLTWLNLVLCEILDAKFFPSSNGSLWATVNAKSSCHALSVLNLMRVSTSHLIIMIKSEVLHSGIIKIRIAILDFNHTIVFQWTHFL
jgi:hypothetical protein